MFTENTAAFLADFGVPASLTTAAGMPTIDSATIRMDSATYRLDGSPESAINFELTVILDQPQGDVLGGHVSSVDYEMTYRTADLPPLTLGDQITVNGRTYTVTDPRTLDDGVFSRARLEI